MIIDTKLNDGSNRIAMEMLLEFACWERMIPVAESLFEELDKRELKIRETSNLGVRVLICKTSEKLRGGCSFEYKTCQDVISSIVIILEYCGRPLWREDPKMVRCILSLRRLGVALAIYEEYKNKENLLQNRIHNELYQVGTDGQQFLAKQLRQQMQAEAIDAWHVAQCVLQNLRRSSHQNDTTNNALLQQPRFRPLALLASGQIDALQKLALNFCIDMDQALSRQIEDIIFSKPHLAHQADARATSLQDLSDCDICHKDEKEEDKDTSHFEQIRPNPKKEKRSSKHKRRGPIFLAHDQDDDDDEQFPPPPPVVYDDEDNHSKERHVQEDDDDGIFSDNLTRKKKLPPVLEEVTIDEDDSDLKDNIPQLIQKNKGKRRGEVEEDNIDDSDLEDDIPQPIQKNKGKRRDETKRKVEEDNIDDSDLEDDIPNATQKGKRKLRVGSKAKPVRTRIKWTQDEIDALIAGMRTHGLQWATIRDSFSIFKTNDRSGTDLRDKWRNMERKGWTLNKVINEQGKNDENDEHKSDEENESPQKNNALEQSSPTSKNKENALRPINILSMRTVDDQQVQKLAQDWARTNLIPSRSEKIHMTQIREAFCDAHDSNIDHAVRHSLENPRSRVSKSFSAAIKKVVGEKNISANCIINKVNQIGVVGYRLRGPHDLLPDTENKQDEITPKEADDSNKQQSEDESTASEDSEIQSSSSRYREEPPKSPKRPTSSHQFYRDPDLARLADSTLTDTTQQQSHQRLSTHTPTSNRQRTPSQKERKNAS